MERLTVGGTGEAKSDVTIREILNKLKNYEDLEEKLEEVYGECPELLKTVINELVKHEGFDLGNQLRSKLLTDESVDQFENWKEADEQGRLIELPCKVGDTVWELCKCDDEIYRIFPMKIKQVIPFGSIRWIKMTEPKIWHIYAESNQTYMYKNFNDFGKTVFITQEEADKALKKMEN